MQQEPLLPEKTQHLEIIRLYAVLTIIHALVVRYHALPFVSIVRVTLTPIAPTW